MTEEQKEYKCEYENGTTPFPLRNVAAIFFNDEVYTLENEQSGGD